MNYQLEVCLVALALITDATPFVAAHSQQAMQKGISVELPVTKNAVLMPDADQGDALIVSVTEDGGVYFGIDSISPAALAETVKSSLGNRTERKLFIKADARTGVCQRAEGSECCAYSRCRSTQLADSPTRLVGIEDSSATERAGSVGWSTIALQIGGDRRASAQLGAATAHPKDRRPAHSMGRSAKYTRAAFPEPKRRSSSSEGRGDIAICGCRGRDRRVPFDGG
jgi:biopolymer transport protein ExbD